MNRFIRPLVVCGLCLAVAIGASGADLFPRGVYWPQERVSWMAEQAGVEFWTYVDQVMAELKAQHCNFIWVVNSDIPSLQKLCAAGTAHNIQVAGNPAAPFYNWRQHRTPKFAVRTAQWAVEQLGDTEGLYAYVCLDEPGLEELAYLDTIRRELKRLDPTRKSVLVTMRPQTPAAIGRTDFPIITCDVYPFFFEGDPNGPNPAPRSRNYYRTVNDTLSAQCQKAGKTYWVMPGVFSEIWGDWYYDDNMHVVAQPGAYLHWRTPTVGESRWMTWQGLASGAQGIIYFVLFPAGNERTAESEPGPAPTHPFPKITQPLHTHQPNALLNIDSTPTEQMIAIGEEFAQVEKLEPILQKLSLSRFPAVFTTAPFHVRTFVDEESDLYALVVNDNTDEPVTGEVTLLPGITQLDDLCADAPLALTEAEKYSLQRATLKLNAGGGTLLRLITEPTHRPMSIMIEEVRRVVRENEIEPLTPSM